MTDKLEFVATDETGKCHHHILVTTTIEISFDILTVLARHGWKLHTITLTDTLGQSVDLPVKAFDGISMRQPLKQLQDQWQAILRL